MMGRVGSIDPACVCYALLCRLGCARPGWPAQWRGGSPWPGDDQARNGHILLGRPFSARPMTSSASTRCSGGMSNKVSQRCVLLLVLLRCPFFSRYPNLTCSTHSRTLAAHTQPYTVVHRVSASSIARWLTRYSKAKLTDNSSSTKRSLPWLHTRLASPSAISTSTSTSAACRPRNRARREDLQTGSRWPFLLISDARTVRTAAARRVLQQ